MRRTNFLFTFPRKPLRWVSAGALCASAFSRCVSFFALQENSLTPPMREAHFNPRRGRVPANPCKGFVGCRGASSSLVARSTLVASVISLATSFSVLQKTHLALILLLLVLLAEPLRWVPQGILYASAFSSAFFVLQRKLALPPWEGIQWQVLFLVCKNFKKCTCCRCAFLLGNCTFPAEKHCVPQKQGV